MENVDVKQLEAKLKPFVKVNDDLQEAKKKFLKGLNFYVGMILSKFDHEYSSEEFKNICNNQLELLKYFKQEIPLIINDMNYYLKEFNPKKKFGAIFKDMINAFTLAQEKIIEEEEIINYQLNPPVYNYETYKKQEIECVQDFFKKFKKIKGITEFKEYAEELLVPGKTVTKQNFKDIYDLLTRYGGESIFLGSLPVVAIGLVSGALAEKITGNVGLSVYIGIFVGGIIASFEICSEFWITGQNLDASLKEMKSKWKFANA